MAQQFQQPSVGGIEQQPQTQSRQPSPQVGQQPQQIGQQPQQVGQQPQQVSQRPASPSLQQYEKTLPSEFRVALHDFNTVAEVADWCRDQCLDKGTQMATVTRTLEDLRDVAELNERLVAHDSAYGPPVAEAFLNIARQSIPELQQHQQDPAVADTIPVVERAIESTEKLLYSVGRQPQQGVQVGQQWQSQQLGQQSSQQLTQLGEQSSHQTGKQTRYGRVAQTR